MKNLFRSISKRFTDIFQPRLLQTFTLLILPCLIWISLSQGEIQLNFAQIWSAFHSHSSIETVLLWDIRLPRLVATLIVGASLAIAGLLLQILSRNVLATPESLGIQDGALFALMLTVIISNTGMMGGWLNAVMGALTAVFILLIFAGGVGRGGFSILVIGIGLATLLRSLTDLALSTLPAAHSVGLYVFSAGSFVGRSWDVVLPAALLLLSAIVISFLFRRAFVMMALSDNVLSVLGVPLAALRLGVVLLAATLAGFAVSVAGPVGFVAIAAPLIARRIAPQNIVPLACSAWIGASLTLAADLIGRLWLAPIEIPAGLISGVFGGIILLWLLFMPQRQKVAH